MIQRVRLLCVLVCGLGITTVQAQILPKNQYDAPDTVVTMPMTLTTSTSMYFSMARKIVSAWENKDVDITVHTYIQDKASEQEIADMLSVSQRIERYLHEKLPNARLGFSAVSTVPASFALPAWQLSTARLRPYGYIVITVHPLML